MRPSLALRRYVQELQPIGSELIAARRHIATIAARLEATFGLPSIKRIGSHARGTAIATFSDVDVLAVLPRKEARWGSRLVSSDTYIRRVAADLQDRYTSILFTGSEGAQYGYMDNWTADGVFRYVGEGQTGDMQFKAGNKAVRDHSLSGKDLLLFQTQGKGKGVRFVGTFSCASWEFSRGPDKKGKERQIIVFNLIRELSDGPVVEPSAPETRDVQTLKAAAYAAASTASKGASGEARRTYYRRCAAIRDYVLARAAGTCESCKQQAPFNRSDGTPYLEPHHTKKLSDGGPDHPRWVAAICPNCHREIHFGKGGVEKNRTLVAALKTLES